MPLLWCLLGQMKQRGAAGTSPEKFKSVFILKAQAAAPPRTSSQNLNITSETTEAFMFNREDRRAEHPVAELGEGLTHLFCGENRKTDQSFLVSHQSGLYASNIF